MTDAITSAKFTALNGVWTASSSRPGTKREARQAAMNMIGSGAARTMRQCASSMMKPPISGPTAGPTTMPTPYQPMALPRSSGGKAR